MNKECGVRNIRLSIETPLGLALATVTDGALVGLWLRDAAMGEPVLGDAIVDSTLDSTHIRTRVSAYFAGDSKAFDGLAMAPSGTPFQRRVWGELTRIPTGETVSYGELAETCGIPKGARAIGSAVGRNPIWIAIPCHRVLAVGGGIGGYAGGISRKLWLLAHEQRIAAGGGMFAYPAAWTNRMHAVSQ
jgi:methylated-DNA-[protein]-cysteine S-methyltransferase